MRASHRRSLVRCVVAWYLRTYHGTPADLGVPAMFCDRGRLGGFATTPAAFSAGTASALFKIIVASTVFQRRQDRQVFRILRCLSTTEVRDLTGARRLQIEARRSRCECFRSAEDLHQRCNIVKLAGGQPACALHPRLACASKRHAVLLRRYADFGKVPTSAALILRERAAGSFGELYARMLRRPLTPVARAKALEAEIMSVWRVSEKICAMILSVLSNPDLGSPSPPWTQGIHWKRFVVIDSNVDNFLVHVGYARSRHYEERARVLRSLARAVRLDLLKPGLTRYNPRVVQQAIYMFASVTNRRHAMEDCSRSAPASCRACDPLLRAACGLRAA